MDPLTHAISGAALARAIPKHHLPAQQFIMIVLLSMAPDADIVLRLFSETLYLEHHRGLTHSILLVPLWGWFIYSLTSRQVQANRVMPWLIGGALLLHIMLDVITTFGTMILAPFSDWRASLDLLFIIDPFFSACMLVPLLLGLIWKKQKRIMGIASLILMCSYLALAYSNQQSAVTLTKQAYPDAVGYNALPLAFSPFHWQLIAIYPDYYMRSSVNLAPEFAGTKWLFDDDFIEAMISNRMGRAGDLVWQKLLAMHTVNDVHSLPGAAFYTWFASYPVLLEKGENMIRFGDLAFGAGAPGVRPAFELQIEGYKVTLNHGNKENHLSGPSQARAYLIWRNKHKSELTGSEVPFGWFNS
ncbi:metal-dependent hydrolase [Mariprofundus sp. EBB-1]|uniref:metal-dependent hydrolase n=1 Tax=Mariprofundus sp. EBB-1 TaxID=2650971 RepID=UPI000EF20718|nr:metal-dependent hydrolase [Mariprofundus sp. EBB-1]RLL52192.1 metal-dependent hydrolase [Mariprofundus sp. EBB-1]